MVARNLNRLEVAAEEIDPERKHTHCYSADVTNVESVRELFAKIEAQFAKVDALFNVAGASARGRLLETSLEEFQQSYDINVLSAVRCTQAAAGLLSRSHGHLVNVGSLASKSASRFLGPYTTSKFALAGFTHQLRLEADELGIHVLFVCPGPISRDDAGTRYNDQTETLPDEIAKPGAGVRVKTIDPAHLADTILAACESRQPEIVMPAKARILFAVSQISARWGDWLLKKFTSG